MWPRWRGSPELFIAVLIMHRSMVSSVSPGRSRPSGVGEVCASMLSAPVGSKPTWTQWIRAAVPTATPISSIACRWRDLRARRMWPRRLPFWRTRNATASSTASVCPWTAVGWPTAAGMDYACALEPKNANYPRLTDEALGVLDRPRRYLHGCHRMRPRWVAANAQTAVGEFLSVR